MIVVALLAVVVGMVSVALRDSNASHLDEEAMRLSALLESARARSRATGQEVRWQASAAPGKGFEFTGLPAEAAMPSTWLDERTQAEVQGAPLLRLGPEPVIGAQSVLLRLADRQLLLATDGLAPFAVRESGAQAPAN
jgi:general secretion pathway protein H